MTKERQSFRLTHEAVELLRKQAEEQGISRTAIMEQAIRAYARRKEESWTPTRTS